MGQTECKACGGTNPATATVKLDQTLLTRLAANPQGLDHFKAEEAEREAAAAAERERAALAAKEARLQREREEQERARCEEARRQLEAERQRERAQAEAEEREARRRRQEREDADVAAAARRAEEEEAEAAAARARKTSELQAAAQRELEVAQRKVDVFLRARGFGSVAAPRTRCFKSSYPLHVAVEENREDMVRALLLCGADTSMRNSAGKTPQEWALRCNRKGSHAAILAIFVAVK